jgi:DNA-binding transcriptional LysR family regulator
MRGSGELFDWEFEKDGNELRVAVPGSLTIDAPELMLRYALDGVGLAYIGLTDAAAAIATGNLVRVLASWCAPTAGFHLYFPSRRHTSAALRALIDALRS